jgi:hypothetical protein
MHLSKVSDIKKTYGCNDGGCLGGYQGAKSDADKLATVSDIGFIVGAVGIGLGIVGLVISKPATQDSPAGAWIMPSLGVGSAGVTGGF